MFLGGWILFLVLPCFLGSSSFSDFEGEDGDLLNHELDLFLNGAFLDSFDEVDSLMETTETLKSVETSSTTESPPTNALTDLKTEVFNSLLSKYQKAINDRGRIIRWDLVEVKGWPEEVVFYSKRHWKVEECRSLMNAIKNGIHFVPKRSTFAPSYTRVQLVELQKRIREVSRQFFGKENIQWKEIKQLCPELHLK